MSKIKKIITEDGSISFYNEDFDDIYHSKVGAYTEALEKFIYPSKILEKISNDKCINVFDVCFGPGYNSKVLLSSLLKKNPGQKINIVGVEIDPDIILHSSDTNFPGYQDGLKNFLDRFLHKVYYTTVSTQYNDGDFFESKYNNINLKFFVEDARQIVQKLNDSFDVIMLDPFSPHKLPCMWSVDIFKQLYRLLNDNGTLLTYSASHCVRGGLIEAGFNLGNTVAIGRKSPGTIATKNIDLIDFPLSQNTKEMIKSTAGIPYEDPDLNWPNERILQNRSLKQKKSTRITVNKLKKTIQFNN